MPSPQRPGPKPVVVCAVAGQGPLASCNCLRSARCVRRDQLAPSKSAFYSVLVDCNPSPYREGRRPLRKGLGGLAFLRGCLKNSEIGTSSVFARRSNTSTVGFSSWRSRPPTYDRSTSASYASLSCESPRLTLTRRRFQATRARPFIQTGGHLRGY
jgi:hypothetical protein